MVCYSAKSSLENLASGNREGRKSQGSLPGLLAGMAND